LGEGRGEGNLPNTEINESKPKPKFLIILFVCKKALSRRDAFVKTDTMKQEFNGDADSFNSENQRMLARARDLREKQTWAEKLMWRWLRDRRFSAYKFRRQHPIGPYVLDFFCKEAELNIELDGSQHGLPAEREHDLKRELYLQERGIKTLRFWNGELRRNARMVRDNIFYTLQSRAPHPLPEYTRPLIAPEEANAR
jgi:very-short-patch-repair endonuclease